MVCGLRRRARRAERDGYFAPETSFQFPTTAIGKFLAFLGIFTTGC